MPATQPKRLVFKAITPCWGEFYVHLFCTYALPNIRACLQRCQPKPETHLLIYTTKSCEPALRAACTAAKDEIEHVQITLIDELLPKATHSYWMMSRCHEMGIASCTKGDLMLLLPPDQIWAVDVLQRCLDYYAEGVKALLVPTLRLSYEGVSGNRCENLVSPTARQLIDLTRLHLHPYMMAFFCDNLKPVNHCTGTYICPILDLGYVMSCFHLHTLLIEAPGHFAPIASTHDHDLVYNLHGTQGVRLIRNSDQIFGIELSRRRFRHEMITQHPIAEAETKNWMEQWACEPNRQNAQMPIRLFSSNYDELDPAHRARFEKAEAALAGEIRQLCQDVPYNLMWKTTPAGKPAV